MQPPVVTKPDSLIYTRRIGNKWYELTDHLGNVRSVISDIKASTITGGQPGNFKAMVWEAYQYYPYGMIMPYWLDADSVVHLATLEDNRMAEEQADFAASYSQAAKITGDMFNHTQDVGANKSLRLTGAEGAMVGLGKSLEVKAGDTVKLEAYAKYFAPSNAAPETQVMAQMFQALTSEFGITPGLDGGKAFQTFNELFAGNLVFPGKGSDDDVKGYLNYLLFDKDYRLIDAGYQAMSEDVSEDGSDVPHDRLNLEVVAPNDGYLYAYLSNESNRITDIYFDDFKITHVTSALADEKVAYRYGFNGQEKTDEIAGRGNHNTALFWEFDTRSVHRWNQDPKSHPAWSPYAITGGNPILNNDILGDTIYNFNVLGFTGITNDGKANVIGRYDAINGTKTDFRFNDLDEDREKIKKGQLRVKFISEALVNKAMVDSDVTTNKESAWVFIERESRPRRRKSVLSGESNGKLDFVTSPAIRRNDVLFVVLPGTSSVAADIGTAFNSFDYGNFLWGHAGKQLGFSLGTLRLAAHLNNALNGKTDNPGKKEHHIFDDDADQRAIVHGIHYPDDPGKANARSEKLRREINEKIHFRGPKY